MDSRYPTLIQYRGPLFKILQTFLNIWLVRTRLGGRLSLQVQPKQGVPQGSVLSPLLFVSYIAEMLTKTTGIKFKYADDSQVLVSAPVESALHRILKRNLNIVEKWCRTWRIQINGSKTEIMHINSDGLTTSVCTLGNEACKIKSKTKILGLIVDDKTCSFKDHTELVVARCKNKWRELRIHCTSRWGLSRNTLTTLYKTLTLPILLYPTLVWSNQNATKLQTFQAFVIRSILQTKFNPNESAAEVILGTPPIDIVCQNISAKFLTKVLQQRDLLSELFMKNIYIYMLILSKNQFTQWISLLLHICVVGHPDVLIAKKTGCVAVNRSYFSGRKDRGRTF